MNDIRWRRLNMDEYFRYGSTNRTCMKYLGTEMIYELKTNNQFEVKLLEITIGHSPNAEMKICGRAFQIV